MTAEPVRVHAPALHRPRLLRQQWCDVAFLHWAVDPAAVAGLLPPGVRPDALDGRDLRRARPVPDGRHRARGRALPCRGRARSWRRTSGLLGRRDGAARRRFPQPGRRSGLASPPPAARSGCVPLVPDAVRRRRRRAALHDPGARWRGPAAAATSRSGGRARRTPGPLPSRPARAARRAVRPAPGSCPTPTHRGRCAPPRYWPPGRRSGRRGRRGGFARAPPGPRRVQSTAWRRCSGAGARRPVRSDRARFRPSRSRDEAVQERRDEVGRGGHQRRAGRSRGCHWRGRRA